jgi:dATP pyrophosphohydrolase
MKDRVAQVQVIIFKLINNEPLFLLLKRNALKGGFWQGVTGGVKLEEKIEDAMKREVFEETGITQWVRKMDNVHYFEYDTGFIEYGIMKEYVFALEIYSDQNIKMSDEHTEMRWCNLEEALKLLKYDNNKEGFKKVYSLLKN